MQQVQSPVPMAEHRTRFQQPCAIALAGASMFRLRPLLLAGAAPIIFALLSDIYPPNRRVLVSTVVLFSTGAGSLLGQTLAGTSGLDWRMPFAIVGVPSVGIATLMLLTTTDPRRGAAEPVLQEAFADEAFTYEERLTWPKFKRVMLVPTNILVIGQVLLIAHVHHCASMQALVAFILMLIRPGAQCQLTEAALAHMSPVAVLCSSRVGHSWHRRQQAMQIVQWTGSADVQGGFGCWPWGVVMAYLNDYLEEEGLSKATATAVIAVFNIGNALGGVIGGAAGHFIWKWRMGTLPVFAGLSVWLGIAPLLWLINADVRAVPVSSVFALAFFAGVVASVAGVEIRPVLMNCNEPEARGIVLALQVPLSLPHKVPARCDLPALCSQGVRCIRTPWTGQLTVSAAPAECHQVNPQTVLHMIWLLNLLQPWGRRCAFTHAGNPG